MSGGHWNYLSTQLHERAGQPLNEVWHLLGAIEHELDWGICCDTCYECAKIRVTNALEEYFDTDATSIENAMTLLRSSKPACEACKKRYEQPRVPQPPQTVSIEFTYEGKTYKGSAREVAL